MDQTFTTEGVDLEDFGTIQRNTLVTLTSLLHGASHEVLRRRPSPDKWCVVEIVAHLADDELVSAWRYRQMIEQPGCSLGTFDQDLWAKLGKYDRWTIEGALHLFRLLRKSNLNVLEGLSPEQWESFGFHPERGRITVRDLARHMAGHDHNHMQQIRRLLSPLQK